VERTLADLGEAPASDQEAIASAELVELVALELVDDAETRVEVADADASKPSRRFSSDPPRRAVVAVMGHVDHGKTTLLDTLRRTSVAATEAGGITQHVGAFVVPLVLGLGDEKNKDARDGGDDDPLVPSGAPSSLTFLDTPGHAAFSAMRKRGASVTDVAVLVCAADDGVMPQTLEAAAHIRAANCAFVVALTKCDAPGADPARVRDQLVASGIRLDSVPGGDVQSVEVSAKTGQGMEDLRMALSLEAEALNLTAPVDDAEALGTVLEARLDPGRGVVIHGLLRRGRLRVGDFVVAGCAYGRVRRLVGADGRDACEVKGVGPSEPFELAGLRRAPDAGDQVAFASTEARARRVADARARRREEARRGALDAFTPARRTQYELEHTHAPAGERGKAASRKMAVKSRLRAAGVGAREGRESGLADDELRRADEELGALADSHSSTSSSVPRALCAIVKADAQGTAEAVRDSLLGLGTGAVGVRVVYLGVGPVTASDVALAAAVGGPVLAFNVREVSNEVEKLAKAEGVMVVNRRVIYHLLDAAGDMLAGLAPERRVEEVAGEAEVRRVFDLSDRRGNKADIVAGCVVNRGTLDGDAKFRVVRDGRAVHEGLLDCASIRRHRSETRTVGKGGECGVSLEGFADVRPGDQIQCVTFVMKRAKVEKVDTGGSRVVEEDSG
jgi:translation initiation factor IF-2